MEKWSESNESYRKSGNSWILKNTTNVDKLDEIEDCTKKVCNTQWVRQLQKRNFGSWISPDFVGRVSSLGFK